MRNPRYVIAVHDLERSAQYYRDVLGFEVRTMEDPGWRFFVHGQCFIMAGECRDAIAPAALGDHAYFAYVETDDLAGFHDEVVRKGAQIIKPLRAEPWGMREFGVRTLDTLLNAPKDYAHGMRGFSGADLDGNELCFGMESKRRGFGEDV